MENTSKSLIISGAILLSILIVSLGVFIYNNSVSSTTDSIKDKELEMQLMQFNKQYEIYEGVQSASNIKILLNMAARNNQELYKNKDTEKLCVCIRSNAKNILSKATKSSNSEMKKGLTTRSYGVKYPSSIKTVAKYLGANDKYKIEFKYNQYGYIWEIWINDIQ